MVHLPVCTRGAFMGAVIINHDRNPRVAGTRITVYDILDYSTAGWHHTAIATTLGISSAQVIAGLEYIEEHKAEVMAGYRKILDRIADGHSPEVQAKVDTARARFQAHLAKRRHARGSESGDAGDSGRQ